MPNIITVNADGPYLVQGEITVLNTDRQPIFQGTEVELCRCGHSEDKPFCDGHHETTGFRDPGLLKENKLIVEDPAPEVTALTLIANRNGSLKIHGPVTIRLADGTEVSGHRGSLCRCGHSKNKPFCDSTHKEIGFNTENLKPEI